MLGFVFELLSAFSRLAYLAAGATLTGIGTLTLGYSAFVRLRERRYAAEVVATHKDAKALYWPTVVYCDAAGARREAAADTGSSGLFGRAPGTRLHILAGATGAPMLERDWWFLVGVGVFFAAVGAPFLVFGMRGLRFDAPTFAAAAVAAAYLAWRAFRVLHRAIDTRHRASASPRVLSPVTQAEIARAGAAQTRSTQAARPWLVVLGAVVCLGASVWLYDVLADRAAAVSAPGTVLYNAASESSDSPSYYAVFRYADAQGVQHTARDTFGSSPAWYAEDQPVTVLYAPSDPAHGWIDRGVWSWLLLAALALAGLGLLLAGLDLYRRRAGLATAAGV